MAEHEALQPACNIAKVKAVPGQLVRRAYIPVFGLQHD